MSDLRSALERAEFALNLAVNATSDDRSWYDEAVDADESARAALAATPSGGSLNVERLAQAMHDSYLRDPSMPRIYWSDLNEADKAMWRNHASNVAAEYARLTEEPG